MTKKKLICQNYKHYAKKNEVSEFISKSLSQPDFRCPSPCAGDMCLFVCLTQLHTISQDSFNFLFVKGTVMQIMFFLKWPYWLYRSLKLQCFRNITFTKIRISMF